MSKTTDNGLKRGEKASF